MSSENVSLKDYTTEQVKEWINTLKMPPNMKTEILTKIDEYDINGNTLSHVESEQEVMDTIEGIKRMTAVKLFQEISKQKEKQSEGQEQLISSPLIKQQIQQPRQQIINLQHIFASINDENKNQDEDEDQDNINNPFVSKLSFIPSIPRVNNPILRNNGKFYLNITGRNGQPKTLDRQTVTGRTKIYEVKQIICDYEGGEPENLELASKGQTLVDDKMLKEYGIENERHNIAVVWKVHGGAQYVNSENRIRKLNSKHSSIKFTKNQCCISFETSDEFPRAQMPCGHAITCESMYQYIKMCSQRLNIVDIKCPVKNCNQIWDFDLASIIGDLTQQEYLKYSNIFEQRRLALTHGTCPNCKVFIKRPNDVSHFRIHCTSCDGDDFCFLCNKIWKGKGMQVCGYEECSTQQINQTLQNCKMVVPEYVSLEVPEYRACPICLTLIGHKSDCKIMTCYHCENTHFCFSCLKYSLDGSYPCPYDQKCEVQPRQTLD